jgi:hypothetical protein
MQSLPSRLAKITSERIARRAAAEPTGGAPCRYVVVEAAADRRFFRDAERSTGFPSRQQLPLTRRGRAAGLYHFAPREPVGSASAARTRGVPRVRRRVSLSWLLHAAPPARRSMRPRSILSSARRSKLAHGIRRAAPGRSCCRQWRYLAGSGAGCPNPDRRAGAGSCGLGPRRISQRVTAAHELGQPPMEAGPPGNHTRRRDAVVVTADRA